MRHVWTGGLATACGLLCSLGLGAGAAEAADPSGRAIAVIQTTDVLDGSGSRVLEVEGPVFMGDRVKTGPNGQAQIVFRDDTRLAIGPNSTVVIDSFVFNEGSATSVTIDAVRGALRFVTGDSPKNAYSIRTPTATIGVRGTILDLSVLSTGETTMALLEGASQMCDSEGRCLDLTDNCAMAVAAPNAAVRPARSGAEQSARLSVQFPFIASQAWLLPELQAQIRGCAPFESINPGVPVDAVGAPPPPPPPPPPPIDTPPDTQTPCSARNDYLPAVPPLLAVRLRLATAQVGC